ncbi:unnamed protein product [Linum trigynum]|uniref:Uncharacterized protein n=1 Tax=Linum trigynum TaxID=586398 RepID=A0AAV2CVK0_9ROSI
MASLTSVITAATIYQKQQVPDGKKQPTTVQSSSSYTQLRTTQSSFSCTIVCRLELFSMMVRGGASMETDERLTTKPQRNSTRLGGLDMTAPMASMG